MKTAGHRRGRLDLNDQIDCPHVDAELERRGGNQAADLSRLQAILDLDPLRPCQRAMMRADQRFAGELVQRGGKPFGDAAAVDEDQGRAVGEDEFEQAGMDRTPDRGAHRTLRCRTTRDVLGFADSRHVFDRHFDLQLQALLLRRVDDRDLAVGRRRAVGGELVVDRFLWIVDLAAACTRVTRLGR